MPEGLKSFLDNQCRSVNYAAVSTHLLLQFHPDDRFSRNNEEARTLVPSVNKCLKPLEKRSLLTDNG